MLWENNYLAHFGIKGQKWGVRRFQNEDGTLTPEGQARYNTLSDRQKKAYLKMDKKDQGRLLEDMAKGKSYTQSVKEARNRAARKALGAFLGVSLATLGIVAAANYADAKRNRLMQEQHRRYVDSVEQFAQQFRQKMQQRQAEWPHQNSDQIDNVFKQVDNVFKKASTVPLHSIHLSPEDYTIK